MKKIFLGILLILVIAVIAAAGFVKLALPNVGDPPEIKVHNDSASVKRGEYLAMHVAACMDCHSSRDWSKLTGPLVEGTLGKGGEYFGPELGFPGKFYSRNITPVGLSNWTDGEIFRAITSGVSKDGSALFPVMPYNSYSTMDKEDVLDIIAYLRQLPAIENDIPHSAADFPMNFILNTIPQKPAFTTRPAEENTVEYGKYLVNMASCMDCHTQVDKGAPIPELAFSGGREFVMPSGTLRSSNITPDKESGIGNWTEETFINKFKSYADSSSLVNVKPNEMNSIMPWSMYAGMKESDLQAIFKYLQSLKPINNSVEKFTIASK
jgi:mono/diheme cytochrome c family protein